MAWGGKGQEMFWGSLGISWQSPLLGQRLTWSQGPQHPEGLLSHWKSTGLGCGWGFNLEGIRATRQRGSGSLQLFPGPQAPSPTSCWCFYGFSTGVRRWPGTQSG